MFVHHVLFAYNRLHVVGPVQNREENRLEFDELNIDFDCPECEERLSVPSEKTGSQIPCTNCGSRVHVPSQMSTVDRLLAGLTDDDEENDHPGSLKIDGISDAADDGSSWHIKCHICDSVLLVSAQQVGSKIKCNDCYSMLDVRAKPGSRNPRTQPGVADVADLEVVEEKATPAAPVSRPKNSRESDELTLMPAVELPDEIKEVQKETYLDEFVEDEPAAPAELSIDDLVEDEPLSLADPVDLASTVNPMFGLGAPDSADDDADDDSDEMIEIVDVAPEELNEPENISDVVLPPTNLPRVPRKKGKQPAAIPVEGEADEDVPVRVHAKRRPKKAKSDAPKRTAKGFAFDEAGVSDVLDKAVGVLKTGKIWIWALVAVAVMAIGSSIWQGLGPHRLDPEEVSLTSRMMTWGAGLVFGHGIFFAGYTILMFVCGVIFRETAQGETKVDAVSVTDTADFTSTMLLFGFSMFMAALPCVFFYMFISLPFQFFLAGCFLFAAWKNQGAFSIVSSSIFSSFSKHSASWKNWLVVAAIAAAGGFVGGLLMEVPLQVISIFTSIAGSVIITFATLFYACVTGWHCGNIVEQMKQAE